MGLKCSLLGHSFDETDVERDREEQGSEVVTVVREVERCRRCGETRVVSENKEVTSIVEPESVGLDREDARDGAANTALDGAAASADADEGFETGSDLGGEFDAPEDPADEDAEILDDDRPAERPPGQWPDDDDEWSPEHLTRPEAAEAVAGERGDADADDADADDADDDESGAEAGEAAADGAERADVGDADPANAGSAAAAGDDAEFIDAEADRSPSGGTDPASAAEYVCPACGFVAATENSPLRAGDACPECQRGYLEARGERNG